MSWQKLIFALFVSLTNYVLMNFYLRSMCLLESVQGYNFRSIACKYNFPWLELKDVD